MPEIECGFCGKRASEVRALVEGPNARICDECVDLCWHMVRPGPEDPPAAPRRTRVRARADKPLHCSFCGRSGHEVSKLLAGIGTFICDACVGAARADLDARGKSGRADERPAHCCSFCGKHQGDVARIIAGPAVNICSECVALCQNIVAQQFSAGSVDTPAAGAGGDSHPRLYCSFCGEPATGSRRLIAGPTVFICHECVTICAGVCADPPPPEDGPASGT